VCVLCPGVLKLPPTPASSIAVFEDKPAAKSLQQSPVGSPRLSPFAACNRFPFNNFKFFLLSFQSPFHLSLTVLVRYRSPASYLALGGVYHPFQAALSSNPTRCKRPLWILTLSIPLLESAPTGISPSVFHTFPCDLEPLDCA